MSGLNAGYPLRAASAAGRGFRRPASRKAANDNIAFPSRSRNNLSQFPTEDVLRAAAREVGQRMVQEMLDPGVGIPLGRYQFLWSLMQPGRWMQTGPFDAVTRQGGWQLAKDCGNPGDVHFGMAGGTVCKVLPWDMAVRGKIRETASWYNVAYPQSPPVFNVLTGTWLAPLAEAWTMLKPPASDPNIPPRIPARMPVEVPMVAPMVAPMALPIGKPVPVPQPWPYPLAPHRQISPNLVEQTEFGYGLARPELLPWAVANGRAALVDRVTMSVRPGQQPKVKLEKAEHRFEPPRGNEKEKKTRSPYGAVFTALRRAVGAATELGDFINAVWWALPKDYRTPWANPYEQFKDLVNNYKHLDTTKALANIAANEIGDQAAGRSNKGWQKVAREMGWTGPSPNVGAGYRQSAISAAE